MMTTRSEMAMASDWSWVTYREVMPSRFCRARSSSRMLSRSLASRLDSGSSNSSTLGSMTTARARATRCCWPPESWLGNRRSMPVSCISSMTALVRRTTSSWEALATFRP